MTWTKRWKKSSRSTNTTNCVELSDTMDAVRDSKNGAVLQLTTESVAYLVASAKAANRQVR